MHLLLFLAFLILKSSCFEIDRDNDEEVYPLFRIYYNKNTPKGCNTKSLEKCLKSNPKEVETCMICGLTNDPKMGPRTIIGGKPVKPPYRYPWMVEIDSSCGGSIISDRFIITAAHCTEDKDPGELQIDFLTSGTETKSEYPVEEIFEHPSYVPGKPEHDIALIKLRNKLTCGVLRNPICLPSSDDNLSKGTALVITGWGWIDGITGEEPNQLLEASVQVTDRSECKNFHLGSLDYCMTGLNNQESACYGDSGGPMFLEKNEKFYVMGVTSRGLPSCPRGAPFVYTSVSGYMKWIEKITCLSSENFESISELWKKP